MNLPFLALISPGSTQRQSLFLVYFVSSSSCTFLSGTPGSLALWLPTAFQLLFLGHPTPSCSVRPGASLFPNRSTVVKSLNIWTLTGGGSEDGSQWGKWPGREILPGRSHLPEMVTGDLDQRLRLCEGQHFEPGTAEVQFSWFSGGLFKEETDRWRKASRSWCNSWGGQQGELLAPSGPNVAQEKISGSCDPGPYSSAVKCQRGLWTNEALPSRCFPGNLVLLCYPYVNCHNICIATNWIPTFIVSCYFVRDLCYSCIPFKGQSLCT